MNKLSIAGKAQDLMAAQAAALHEGCEQPHGDLDFGFLLHKYIL